MAFGHIMRLQVDDKTIELAPITKEDTLEYIQPGLQQETVGKYLGMRNAPVPEDQHEWFEKTRTSKNQLVWGVWLIEGKKRTLIGNSALNDIKKDHMHQAVSGSMIAKKEYWGQGIASAIHKARTWYAFEQLGLHRIMSAVIQGNQASLKALQKSGYTLVYVERNELFVDGKLRHMDNLECLNPNEPFWSQWWGDDEPTEISTEARKRTQEVLAWARENVELL